MQSQKPTWMILFVVAIGVGFYIHNEVSSWPTEFERTMANHNELMKRIKGISK